MKIGGTSVRQRLAISVLATVLAVGCAKFSGTEPAPDGGSLLDASVNDAPSSNDGAEADGLAPANPCPGGAHTFCDDFDRGETLDARWASVTNAQIFSFSPSNAVSQPRSLRVAGARSSPSALAHADARLPTPVKSIRCEAQLRVQQANAEGSLPLALRLAGPAAYVVVLLFLFPDAFELGAERAVGSASPIYANVYKRQPIPQLDGMVKTSIELSLVDKRLRLAFGPTVVATLDVDVPAGTTSTTLSIGDLRVNASSGVMVETFFDDVSCDVDLP